MLQTAGTSLQLLGAVVAALGLLYAWERASGRFEQWRDSVKSKLVQLRGQLTRRYEAEFTAHMTLQGRMDAELEVDRPGTLVERLHRVENEVATLLGRVGQVNEATKAAIDEKLAEFDATGKGFAVKDISWALVGLGIAALGNVLNLGAQLST